MSSESQPDNNCRGALVTGAARRLGAAIARALHSRGYHVAVHVNRSISDGQALVDELNGSRSGSASLQVGDLCVSGACEDLIERCLAWSGRLDVLVNNASSFYPTPIGQATEEHWDDLLSTNLKAPFFLTQAAASALKETRGCVVNMTDISADKPTLDHPIYCAAKAGLVNLTKSLARDMAPDVRVNAVAPGVILWPADGPDWDERDEALRRIPLGAMGTSEEIARAVMYLAAPDSYVTGQVLTVDGGRSLT
jgi:pteridine reductase